VGFFVNCVVGKAYPDAFSGADNRRLKAIRDARIRARSKPPAGDNWLHEIKYDGYRLQIHLDKGRVTIRARTGLDCTKRFSAIAAAFDIPADRAIFDGRLGLGALPRATTRIPGWATAHRGSTLHA
jgi:hypothetical protein